MEWLSLKITEYGVKIGIILVILSLVFGFVKYHFYKVDKLNEQIQVLETEKLSLEDKIKMQNSYVEEQKKLSERLQSDLDSAKRQNDSDKKKSDQRVIDILNGVTIKPDNTCDKNMEEVKKIVGKMFKSAQ